MDLMTSKCPGDLNLHCQNGGHCKKGKGKLDYHESLKQIPLSIR